LEKEINRFIAMDPNRTLKFEAMANDLSGRLSMSPEVIRHFGQEALSTWEKTTNQPIVNLYVMKKDQQYKELAKIVDYFYEEIQPFVGSQKKLEKSLNHTFQHYLNLFTFFE